MKILTQDPIATAHRMIELCAQHALTPRQKVERLQASMAQMPQVPDLETEHYFVPGMYCRRLFRKAGTVIVGKVHLAPHFFMCAAGEILVLDGETVKTLRAGDVIECPPGTKRATYALTDAVGITIHKTDKTDLDEIEVELIEPDNAALFDADNAVKVLLQGESK